MYLIEFNDVRKEFDECVIDNLNLYVRQNEFITLLGPSGCGKTTILRMLAGFETLTKGEIFFEGEPISSIPPHKRPINTVFQNYALFPHLNVYDNIAFGLRQQKKSSEEIDIEVTKVLQLVKLTHLKTRKISKLSGGQSQRVAIARAIVNKPKVLLLDEPLNALDLKLRQEMQYELKAMQSVLGITFVFVTHNQEEALVLSDTIVVMNHGRIQQIGTPIDIYNEPKNKFVAEFIGDSNIFEGVYEGNKKVKIFNISIDCVDENFVDGEICDVVIRPEDINIVSRGIMKVVVENVVFKGVHYEIIALYKDFEVVIHTYASLNVGDVIEISIDASEVHLMKRERNEKT